MADLPDLTSTFAVADVPDGGLLHGRVGAEEVVVVRAEGSLRAIGASCSHYGGPLAEGVFDGRCVRCPWHHAAFDTATGRAERGPAITAVAAYRVVVDGATAVVEPAEPVDPSPVKGPDRIVVVGGGPAAHAFVHRLVERGATGEILLIGDEPGRPIDRPNVSKDYLAGEADPEWMPLPGAEVYDGDAVELRTGTSVTAVDLEARTVTTDDGTVEAYDVLVLATGAEPRRLPDDADVRYLRTQADADAIAEALGEGGAAVVVGGSWIGLEAASSLVARGATVDLVAPEPQLLVGLVGEDLSARIELAQRQGGVTLHLGREVQSVVGGRVQLDDGTVLEADVVLAGIGVTPRTGLLESAGVPAEDGVAVDSAFRVVGADGAAIEGVLAIGDIARAPWGHLAADDGEGRARIEHVSVAISHGMAAADALLGLEGAMPGAPFFWTAQHDMSLRYVGHATDPERFEVDGDPEADDATVKVWQDGRIAAVITIGRDGASLLAELALEAEDQGALAAL